jgi:RNA polymerase-binding protein DksA
MVLPWSIRVAYHRAVETRDSGAIRAALLEERARLLGDREETIVAPDQMTYGSQAAAASQVFAQQRDLALRDRADHQLVLVDEALARLDAGTFGTCVRCGREIPDERLEALPWAPRCIDCQRLADREH